MHRIGNPLALCVGLWLLAGCARVPGVEVPDVRTPPEVVTEILRLAGVGAEDVVYDLGSGDGRIVIATARDFGGYGVCAKARAEASPPPSENGRIRDGVWRPRAGAAGGC